MLGQCFAICVIYNMISCKQVANNKSHINMCQFNLALKCNRNVNSGHVSWVLLCHVSRKNNSKNDPTQKWTVIKVHSFHIHSKIHHVVTCQKMAQFPVRELKCEN